MIAETKKAMKEFGCEYIYLCVEEKRAKDRFLEVFGEKCIYYECNLVDDYDRYVGKGVAEVAAISNNYKSGEDYIVSIMLLAECDSFLTSGNSGSVMARIINNGKYEHFKLVTNERYGEAL